MRPYGSVIIIRDAAANVRMAQHLLTKFCLELQFFPKDTVYSIPGCKVGWKNVKGMVFVFG